MTKRGRLNRIIPRPSHRLVPPAARAVWIAAIIALFAGLAQAQSGHHGDGHAEQHDIYKEWKAPNNPALSCCNNADCRPTRAFLDQNGDWRAWNGHEWLRVPWDRVLPADYAGDGRSHLCEKETLIYCFTPGQVRG